MTKKDFYTKYNLTKFVFNQVLKTDLGKACFKFDFVNGMQQTASDLDVINAIKEYKKNIADKKRKNIFSIIEKRIANKKLLKIENLSYETM